MSEEISAKSILDYTAVITIGSILLYQLGWVYWETYLNLFNIDSSFIDIPFEKMISTTWTSILFVIIAFSRSIETAYYLKEEDEIYTINVVFLLVIGILLTLFIQGIPHWISIGGLIMILIGFFAKIPSRIKDFFGVVNRTQHSIIVIVIVYAFTFGVYIYKANKNADKILSNYENDIEIVMNDNNKVMTGKFIIFMNDKYYILMENKKCKRELIVINNSEVNHSKILTKI